MTLFDGSKGRGKFPATAVGVRGGDVVGAGQRVNTGFYVAAGAGTPDGAAARHEATEHRSATEMDRSPR